ncbi:unnamed protein product [Arabidopsis thaliana]|uniref:Uncharacterized protein n=3 Tax=Arabidopsis TaxID=3701 RepID=A0A654G4E6_ARATH|nr:uncharacterized protein AT5G26890 [Arabidopsis thaliana]AED93620.1 hypothetical protein AT5G26890 [Arabidopsis thaliana]KAG7610512.1 hypothetical protein ISN44_As05g025160 [Arabidopsis suecica]VYS68031.1 unnamed protein product [Arabidopsis thaliana]|eukprot:NP_198041.1 hypothetical protein AT5G26890 [Arabidopsis thaliana]
MRPVREESGGDTVLKADFGGFGGGEGREVEMSGHDGDEEDSGDFGHDDADHREGKEIAGDDDNRDGKEIACDMWRVSSPEKKL